MTHLDLGFSEDLDQWDPTTSAAPVGPHYDSLESWLNGWLLQMVRRRRGATVHWCPKWWAHPEAVSRLGALWAAWEQAQEEGGSSPSTWWIYHFDGQYPHIFGASGPFAGCDTIRHLDPQPPWPTVPVPDDLAAAAALDTTEVAP